MGEHGKMPVRIVLKSREWFGFCAEMLEGVRAGWFSTISVLGGELSPIDEDYRIV